MGRTVLALGSADFPFVHRPYLVGQTCLSDPCHPGRECPLPSSRGQHVQVRGSLPVGAVVGKLPLVDVQTPQLQGCLDPGRWVAEPPKDTDLLEHELTPFVSRVGPRGSGARKIADGPQATYHLQLGKRYTTGNPTRQTTIFITLDRDKGWRGPTRGPVIPFRTTP